MNRFIEHREKLIFGDAAQGFIFTAHADVVGLVETAEHAYLRELRHAGEQYELQVLVGILEDPVESPQ